MQEDDRTLAAILAIEAVGFSAAAERDEAAAVSFIQALRACIDEAAAAHGGRIVTAAGDSFLLEFPLASDAVAAALAVLKAAGPKGNMRVRIGGHMGEVIAQGGDLVGPAVNVAARLAAQAAPDQFLISDALKAERTGRTESAFAPVGLVKVNKGSPVMTYAYVAKRNARATLQQMLAPLARAWRWLAAGVAGLLAAAALSLALNRPAAFDPQLTLDWIETHPGVAAWVQAAGTLLALVTAMTLPYIQRRALERSRAQKARPIVLDMWNAARNAYYFCFDKDESLSRADVADHLRRARHALEDFPTHELREAAIAHLFHARDRLVLLEQKFANANEEISVARIPATVRAICQAIIEAMDAESALASSRPLRAMMAKLAADTGLERTPV